MSKKSRSGTINIKKKAIATYMDPEAVAEEEMMVEEEVADYAVIAAEEVEAYCFFLFLFFFKKSAP